jgi:hypothetical protein
MVTIIKAQKHTACYFCSWSKIIIIIIIMIIIITIMKAHDENKNEQCLVLF